MIVPQYAENIIVGIKNRNQFGWYVIDKFLCLLDLNKLNSQDYELYMQNEEFRNIRINYKLIDNNNIENFLDEIDCFKVKPENLQMMIMNSVKDISNSNIDDFYPVLFFDFDNHSLYSQYPEYFDFKSFLPQNWEFYYSDFSDLIANDNRYWIYKNCNIIDKSIKKINDYKSSKYNITFNIENQKSNTYIENSNITVYKKKNIFKKIIDSIKNIFQN